MSQKQPLLFVGHGSPMNAIEDTKYTREWKRIGEALARPRSILMLSAHWITEWETRITTAEHPEMIYDMYGFPDELYRVRYNAPGSPAVATEIQAALSDFGIHNDPERGLDHGAWSVLLHLFPEHDIPVVSVSLDYSKSPRWHYEFGQKLRALREQGICIIASGNTVHNLQKLDFSARGEYAWAREFDDRIQKDILLKNYEDIVDFENWGPVSRLAHPTYDHLLPLIVGLGAIEPEDRVELFNQGTDLASISMTSMIWR